VYGEIFSVKSPADKIYGELLSEELSIDFLLAKKSKSLVEVNHPAPLMSLPHRLV